MRHLIAIGFVTLDGVVQSPGGPDEDTSGGLTHGGWVRPYPDPVQSAVIRRQMSVPFDLLLGRTTFEIWAPYWPAHPEVWPEVQAATKYVASNTLTSEGGEVMQGDVVGGPIRWRMHVPAAPERVFAEIDSDAGGASFWAESAVETGGYVVFRFSHGLVDRSRILEREAPLSFSLEYFGRPARFELTPDGDGGTELLLTHDGVRPEEWIEVHAGWLNVLLPLKAWVVHGVDLRNHDAGRSWHRGYAGS